MDFGQQLRTQRRYLGLTQADVAAITGIARSNIAAYEAGRREPRLSTATTLLAAVRSALTITPNTIWSWTTGLRPYAVPSQLWRLPIHQALATITTSQHFWWSGPDRTLDLGNKQQRHRAYELILREGTPADIETVVDGLLLTQAWPHLVVPAELRKAWNPLINTAHNPATSATAA